MKLRHVFFLRVRVRFSLLRIGRVSVAACRLLQPQLYGGSGWAGSRWQGGEVAGRSISYHPCPLAVSRRAAHTGHSAHAESSSACKMRTAQLVALAQEQIWVRRVRQISAVVLPCPVGLLSPPESIALRHPFPISKAEYPVSSESVSCPTDVQIE